MLKILMVEDSSTFRKTFGSALRKRFPLMVIEEAVDGREALQKIETFVPDLVFMDIRLPGASGLELTRRIKASHPEIVIIILTNYDVPEYRAAAHNGGADAFIPKDSLGLDDIAALIESFFSGRTPDFGRPPEKGSQKKNRIWAVVPTSSFCISYLRPRGVAARSMNNKEGCHGTKT